MARDFLTNRVDLWMQPIEQEVIAGDIYCVVRCAGNVQGQLHVCEVIVPNVIKRPLHFPRCMANQGYEP